MSEICRAIDIYIENLSLNHQIIVMVNGFGQLLHVSKKVVQEFYWSEIIFQTEVANKDNYNKDFLNVHLKEFIYLHVNSLKCIFRKSLFSKNLEIYIYTIKHKLSIYA